MNEISVITKQLPANIEEVSDFVVLNEEKLNAIKLARRTAKKVGAAKEATDELERQERELSKELIAWQCKLGELTSGIEKASHDRGNQYTSGNSQTLGAAKTKSQQLEQLGIDNRRTSEYERMAKHPDIVQKHINEAEEKGEVISKSKILADIKKEDKRQKQEAIISEKIESAGNSIDIFTTNKKYKVIYADPPWQYSDKQNTYKLGGAEKFYPTMPLQDICSLPVNDISDSNSVLFIWVTSPMLEDCFKVINAWGYKYKSSFIWDKIAHNMGHYNSVRHEFLLICTKGSCTPDNIKLFDSVQSIERTEHSKKPEEFRNIIDTLYCGEKIELFARVKPDNWDVWGNMA